MPKGIYIRTDTFLAYLDGYDKNKNVILEYDSKYHNRPNQKKADLIRQQKIIDVLNPKVFWRYDSVNDEFTDVYRSDHNLVNQTSTIER
jgi:CRISPR/Cas system CSM-associated protein Csm5 (group 7 of RAMP superfamily)